MNYRCSLVLGYKGHGKRWGVIRFGNGRTFRAGLVALHVWRLGAND
jgi:hypothetical protein